MVQDGLVVKFAKNDFWLDPLKIFGHTVTYCLGYFVHIADTGNDGLYSYCTGDGWVLVALRLGDAFRVKAHLELMYVSTRCPCVAI